MGAGASQFKAGDAERWRAIHRFVENLPTSLVYSPNELVLWTSEENPPALVTALELANAALVTAGLDDFTPAELTALQAPPLEPHKWVTSSSCRCGDCGRYSTVWCTFCEACRKCFDDSGGGVWCLDMAVTVV